MLRRLLFNNFRLVFNVDRWIRRQLTPAGSLAFVGLIAASIFGVDTSQGLAYQLFSLLLILLLLAWLNSWFFRIRLTAQRYLPKFATVGEILHYRIKLTNHSNRWQRDLILLDNLQSQAPDFKTFLAAKEPGYQQRNWFDNYVGYPRWVWLMRLCHGADLAKQPLPPLSAQSTEEINLTLMPLRRGYIHFTGCTVACPDPFGLFNALYTLSLPDHFLVLPKRYPVPTLSLPGSRKYQPGGVQLAMSVSDAQELVSLRDYRPGDPLRHIHWKSLAKLGKPVVKEFQDQFFVRYALILDTFIEATTSPLFEAAVTVAASLVCAPRNHETLLDLMFVGTKTYCLTSGRGLAYPEQLLEVLACVQPSPREHQFASLSALVMDHANSLSGCLCVLLNWDAARQSLVQLLNSRGIPSLVIVVTETEIEVPNAVKVLHINRLASELAQLGE